jgi:hypothetical protein
MAIPLTVFLVLALLALLLTIGSAVGWCPLWVPVVLLAIIELLRALPLGK